MGILDWLLPKKSPEAEPDIAAILAAKYPDDPSLSDSERSRRAIYSWRYADLANYGADGIDALVACLISRSGITRSGAEGAITNKQIASQVTPALAAALDHPDEAYARAGRLELLAKVDEGHLPRAFVLSPVLKALAEHGDAAGIAAVVRVYRQNDLYSEAALAALRKMLGRRDLLSRLPDDALSDLAALPDLSQAVVGEEADRFATSVYLGDRTLSAEPVRAVAQAEIERRAQRPART